MKKIFAAAVAIFIVIAAYLYASPYLALNSIKNAAENKNADKLNGYIDFPSVKQSLKDQIKAQLAQQFVTNEETDGFEALGAMFASTMVDPIIDSMITPEAVALMMQGESLDTNKSTPSESQPSGSESGINNNDDNKPSYKASYTSFNTFKVQIGDEETMDVIMHRDGLSWKVTKIEMPMDMF